MIKNLKHFIIVFFFTALIETTVSAKEYFCLEDEGFIYPLFEETNCENTQDEKITKEEFINIFNINQKDRKIKLTEFRKNIEEGTQEVKTEKDIEAADVIKIKKESIKKIEFNKRKQKQLAKIEERKILQKQKRLKNLAKIPARSITVFLDACFSGDSPKGMIVRETSGLSVEIKRPKTVDAKMVVITASKDDQFASWDEDAKHGLFTKHIIEGLSGVAYSEDFNGNGDGKVTVG